MKMREETDSMGVVRVPEDAYYGAQTQRAVENFRMSDLRFPPAFIHALGLIKKHAAGVNLDLGQLDQKRARAIQASAGEVVEGKLDAQFVVDLFQTGSGTSTNMNANEVIAGRSNEMLAGSRGGKSPVHPNDHVNLGQSSNDAIPTALHVAALTGIVHGLLPAMGGLQKSLEEKAETFASIRKIGRTHLQDAVPMSLGQAFGGYARQIALGIERMKAVEPRLSELALGGTAVGTGMNTHPEFARRVIEGISGETGCAFREARDHFEAQGARDAAVETSGALKTLAVSLIKIANDLRWLSSGPRCGLGEMRLPALQPGSSIMPGKINPVIPEAVIQAAGQVIGNDAAVTFGGQAGNLELNVTMPLIAHNLLQSIDLLRHAAVSLAEKCIKDLSAHETRLRTYLEQSLALATALVPAVGYDRAAVLAKEAYRTGKTVRETALAQGILPEAEIHRILDQAISGRP